MIIYFYADLKEGHLTRGDTSMIPKFLMIKDRSSLVAQWVKDPASLLWLMVTAVLIPVLTQRVKDPALP